MYVCMYLHFVQLSGPGHCASCYYDWDVCHFSVNSGACINEFVPPPFTLVADSHLPLLIIPLRSVNVTCNYTLLPDYVTCNATINLVGDFADFDPLALVGESYKFTVPLTNSFFLMSCDFWSLNVFFCIHAAFLYRNAFFILIKAMKNYCFKVVLKVLFTQDFYSIPKFIRLYDQNWFEVYKTHLFLFHSSVISG